MAVFFQLQPPLANLSSPLKQLESQIELLEGALKNANDENEALIGALKNANDENEALIAAVDTLLEGQLKEDGEKRRELESGVGRLLAEKSRLQNLLKMREAELEKKVHDLSAELGMQIKDSANKTRLIEDLKQEKMELQAKLKQLEERAHVSPLGSSRDPNSSDSGVAVMRYSPF
jgi:DNA repair exonuclease SbcCD ATPase subunit